MAIKVNLKVSPNGEGFNPMIQPNNNHPRELPDYDLNAEKQIVTPHRRIKTTRGGFHKR